MSTEYSQYWYWENMVINEKPLWDNSFKNLNLTRDSVFIYSMIMCKERGILKNSWAYYPNVESILGFIEHVFMPTAFFTWFADEDEFKIPVATVGEVLNVMSEEQPDNFEIETMWEYTEKLQSIWKEEQKTI